MPVRRQHGSRWSDAELAELSSLAGEGVDHELIAIQLGRSQEAIRAKLSKANRSEARSPSFVRTRQRRRDSGASFFLS